MATISIADHGVSPFADDNTAAIQAAIDAAAPGDTLWNPWDPSVDILMRRTASPWAALVNKRLILDGPGRYTMHPEDAADAVPAGNAIALFYFTAAATGSAIRNITLEGSKVGAGGPTEYDPLTEHHRAVFFDGTEDVDIEYVKGRNFTGDFLQLYNGCRGYRIRYVTGEWCQRDHITLSPSSAATPVRDVLIEHCTLRGASNQQIDNEHGPAHNVEIRYCTLECADNALSIGLVIAGAGTDASAPSTGWNVHHCDIVGGIRYTWTSYSRIADCNIVNPRRISGIELERMQTGNRVLRNTIVCTQDAIDNLAGIYCNGTNGGGASDLVADDNVISLVRARSFGIRADGLVSGVFRRNDLTGAGSAAAGYYGIRIRATSVNREVESVSLIANRARDFGAAGIGVAGTQSGGKKGAIRYLEAIQNELENTSAGGPQKTGLVLSDALGTLRGGRVAGNVYGLGVTTEIVPAAAPSVEYSFATLRGAPYADLAERGRVGDLCDRGRTADLGERGRFAEAA